MHCAPPELDSSKVSLCVPDKEAGDSRNRRFGGPCRRRHPCCLVLNNVLGSVIGFVITDIISAMRALSSSPFVEVLVDEIMEMS